MERSESDRIVPSVLLVDDRPENLLALEGVLKPIGARLVKARSGEEALLQLLRDTFAVILLDVQMPRLDGLQTAELIKQREQTRHIPIIFITALSRETAYIFKGYEHGAVSRLSAVMKMMGMCRVCSRCLISSAVCRPSSRGIWT